MENDKLLRYSIQLDYLSKLLRCKLISDREYSLIKNKLMNDYQIVSDILAGAKNTT